MNFLNLLISFFLICFCYHHTFAQKSNSETSLSYSELDRLIKIEYNKNAWGNTITLLQNAIAKSHSTEGKDSVLAHYTRSLGQVYTRIGKYDQALPLFSQAIDLIEKGLGKDHPDYAKTLNILADYYETMGDYEKALSLCIQAKDIQEKLFGENHIKSAATLNILAGLYSRVGKNAEAVATYIKAKSIIEKVQGRESEEFAGLLNNLGGLYHSLNNYPEALAHLLEAKTIQEKILPPNHPLIASTLNHLGHLYLRMRDFEKAQAVYSQANDIRAKAFGLSHPSYCSSLNHLTNLYLRMGNIDKAWESAFRSTQLLSQTNASPANPTINQAWSDSLLNANYPSNLHIEKILIALRHLYILHLIDPRIQAPKEKQVIIITLAIDLLNQFQNGVSSEKDKLRMLSFRNFCVQVGLDCLTPTKDNKKAFHLIDENKSVLLLQATKSESAYQLGELPDSLIWKDKEMLNQHRELEAKLLEPRLEQEKDSLRNKFNHSAQNIEKFLLFLKHQYPKYYRLKYQQVETKLEAIQKTLDDKTVLLEYAISDSLIHIFSVSKKDILWIKQPINNTALKNKTRALHKALSNYSLLAKDAANSYQIYTSLAHWFYQKLLAPVLKEGDTIENLVIISDGELGHLPFEVFLVNAAPQAVTDYHALDYLLNTYNISYNYSATLWKENTEAKTSKNNDQILGIAANYELKLDPSLLDIRLPNDQFLRESLEPLPAARKEVETLAEKYVGFFAFDQMASEKTVKEKATDYAILHFATHGILDYKRPLLSSLAFTEDNDSTESNFWQAHEISKMELNANLVVLSACETGYGHFEEGNGIASLARAFMYAGASSLIVSLWQVNDYATSEIMKNLYENIANEMKIDEALRHAKLQYMKTAKGMMAHPAFWSPFIQMGNTQSISIQRKRSSVSWILGFGLLILIGLGGFLIKRKK